MLTSVRKNNNLNRELTRVVGSLLQLKSVGFHRKGLNDAVVAALAEVIQTNSTLTKLHLSENAIAEAGAAALAKAIQTNSALTELNLRGNSILCFYISYYFFILQTGHIVGLLPHVVRRWLC